MAKKKILDQIEDIPIIENTIIQEKLEPRLLRSETFQLHIFTSISKNLGNADFVVIQNIGFGTVAVNEIKLERMDSITLRDKELEFISPSMPIVKIEYYKE